MRFAEPLRSVTPGKSDLPFSFGGNSGEAMRVLEHVVVRPRYKHRQS